MSKKSCNQFGLIGVDVKSHQTNSSYPYPVIIEGNDAQDTYCNCTNVRHLPADILLPSGGPLAFLCKDRRMVTTIPNKFTRGLLRRQSVARMATKLTQDQLCNFKGRIYSHTRWIFVRLSNVRFPLISSTFCSLKIERARLI